MVQDTTAGVLFIVKNYTGDRLNFGMAIERANLDGRSCEAAMVVVADDCALPRDKGITGARGVAGTVLVHKVAGGAASLGLSLAQVMALAKRTASRMGTLGVALDSVTVPGAEQKNDRLDESTIEIGLGIHGEAGMKQSPLISADDMAREMVAIIQKHGRVEVDADGVEQIVPMFAKGDEVVVLVNNLGGTSNFEMSILARSCVKLLESEEYGVKATRVFVGSFMTSFGMHGASLTILNVQGQQDIIDILDLATDAPAWQTCDVWTWGAVRPSMTEVPEVVADEEASVLRKPDLLLENFAVTAKALAIGCVEKLAEAEPILTKYDTIVGDGDCGITMKRGATEVLERIQSGVIPVDHPVSMFVAIADAVSKSMGGTSGVLIELMFRKMASSLSRTEKIGVDEFCHAFKAGVDAVSFYGGAQVGSRTMLDALVPGAAALIETKDLAEAAARCRVGADGTAIMKSASAGRSNYLSEDSLYGTPDPGAVAVAIVMESLCQT